MTLPSISRALKPVRRTVFALRDADAGLRLAVTASGCAPWAGLAFCDRCACFGFLFPPQAAVASAAGCSIPVWVTIYARHLLKSKYKEKRTTSNEVVLFGDPYGNRTHVTAVKGPCLNHLTNGPYNTRDAFASRAFGSGTWIRTGDTSGMNRMLWPTELCRHILPDRTRDSITGRRSVCQ